MAIRRNGGGTRVVRSWNPHPIARPIDRLAGESVARWMPAVDLEETGDQFVLTADLPGFTGGAVEIGLEKRVLTLRGEIAEESGGGDRRYHLRERRLRRFRRSFTLPRSVSADRATATCEDGVLQVRMPKTPESTARTIPIRGAS